MENTITRICSIKDHPIKKLPESFRIIYLKGLGAVLSRYKNNDGYLYSLYKAWCLSLLDTEKIDSNWFHSPNEQEIKRAIGIQRIGFRFFSMKYTFFFDCCYLLSSIDTEIDILGLLYEFLMKNHCGFWTKGALKKVMRYFKEGISYENINIQQKTHLEKNNQYKNQNANRILVVANVSACKSTMINALVGHRSNRTKATACTNKLCCLYNKPFNDGILYYDEKLHKYEYSDDMEEVTSDKFNYASFHFNSLLQNDKFCFIDTPGVNNVVDSEHWEITKNAICNNQYNAIIYVSNCRYFGTNDEKNILTFLKKNTRKTIIFVLNQLDSFKQKEDSIDKMLTDYKSDLIKMGFKSPIIIPISAKAALLFKLSETELDEDELFEKEIYERKFEKDYYNLLFKKGYKGNDLIERTGIRELERILMNNK